MATSGLYRRVLPSPPAIDFASDEGKKLFIEAIQAGTMEGFYKLISYFQTQSELTYCGLASLSMVMNALAIDPGRKWKGPWRWYDESMLGCPKELKKIKAEGISFGNTVHWARRAGAEVEAFQTSQTDVDFFRQSLKKCCSSDNCHLVSSYHRAGLEQTGAGHFSPIGGYHAGSDMVLILDVARFKYRPHWVPLTLLWEAMDAVNKTTGQRRGFMLISKPKRDAGLLYTLVLPSPPAINFTSDEGKKLFREALLAGTMEGYFMLISYFQTQSELTYSGLASLSMALNALAIDPGRTWKGPWRWYDESMLGCPKELKKIKAEGISFGNAVHWARRAGAEVEAFQTSQTDVDFFRQSLKKCCSSDNCHLVSSYHRAGLEQTGTGHFSPIGGYHAGSDMVLILDVARFKYPPHWVPLTLLWEAMDTVDKTTGQRRGFMLISRPKRDPRLLCTLSCKNESWVSVVKYLMDDVPHLLKSEDVKDINGILSILLASPPSSLGKFIQWVAEVKREQDGGIGISEEEKQRLAIREELLKQVQDTGFFKYIVNFLSSTSCCGRVPVFGGSGNLHEIAASICCQGAEILSGKSGTSGCSCGHETCVKCMKADGHKTGMVLSATIVKGKNKEKVNMLVPQSLMELCCCAPDPNNCSSTQPVGSNILTALLLTLPPETWYGIKDEKLQEEVQSLVSMDNLPAMLQEQVLHLRRQLYHLKKCQENMVDEILPAPCP